MDIKCKYDELLTLNKIITNPRNPNYHSQDSIKLLANNIDYQGIRWPIIISKRSGFIAAGHGRLEAAKLLKYEHFPVVYQDFESEAQEYEFLVADNRLGELSEIDKALVLEAFEELPELKIEMLGFDEKDLGEKIFTRGDESSGEFDDVDIPKDKVKKLCPHCGEEL